MSSKFNETINQFKVGDFVREKGKEQVMQIIGNMPGVPSFEHYLKSDKFECGWKDEKGEDKTGFFYGSDLESA